VPLRCLDADCSGTLDKTIDSRDGSFGDTGDGIPRKVFNQVKAWMGCDGFRWRLRECNDCGKRWSTIEEVMGPNFGAEPAVRKEKKAVPNLAELKTKPKYKPILSVAEHDIDNQAAMISKNMTGFSGEQCEQCGSMQTVRTGTCVKCQVCYHDGGCG